MFWNLEGPTTAEGCFRIKFRPRFINILQGADMSEMVTSFQSVELLFSQTIKDNFDLNRYKVRDRRAADSARLRWNYSPKKANFSRGVCFP